MRRKTIRFIKNHNLVNRIYEMLKYFDIIDYNKRTAINSIKDKMIMPEFIESLASIFEKKYKYCKKVEVRCNLKELIDDLNILKQYLEY